MSFIEELNWRGMIHDMMPGLEEQLKKEMTTAYVGIDPTADSLHIGLLVSVMMLFLYLPYTKLAHLIYRTTAYTFERYRTSVFAQS